jgi:hypothetical protein
MKLTQFLLCAAFFLLLGCGSSNTSPPSQGITGTYKLSSASGRYVYQSGVLSFDLASSITGTLIIGLGSWNETYAVDGVIYSKHGTYSINYTNGTVEGTLGIDYQNGGCTYSFLTDGYNLNLKGSPNSNWTKVSQIENFELGTLQIVDHGPAIPSSWETHITVDSSGKITSTQYAVQNGVITEATYTWEYQMSLGEKSVVEQQATNADILYRGDVASLLEGSIPCTGAGDLVFHAISKSEQEHQFVVPGEVRCANTPAPVSTLYSTITGWTPAYAQ